MKNKHIEKLRAASKKYRKSAANSYTWDPVLKIRVYHCYKTPKPRGYWDDTAFIMGSQMVSVWWTHPRYDFYETIDGMAYDIVSPQYANRNDDFAESTPIYKKLGRNKKRKRVMFYRMGQFREDRKAFYKKWADTREEMLLNTTYVQKAHMKVEQFGYCRGVSICYPIEVVDATSLKQLADDVRKFLENPGLFEQLYSDYMYNVEDYAKDKAAEVSER